RKMNARRIRIELPWMQGKDGRPPQAVFRFDDVQHATGRAHPQTPSPSHPHRLAEAVVDERPPLKGGPRLGLACLRIASIHRDHDEAQRRHARIEYEALARENVQRPERTVVDGPLRRPEQAHVLDARLLERPDAVAQIADKSLRTEVEGALMSVAMR